MSTPRKTISVPFTAVSITDTFWSPRIKTNREVTLPHEYKQCSDTGRIDAFKLQWKKGQPNEPHIFWDSDVAKWIEAASYSVATHPDAETQRLLDEVVDIVVSAQQPDGYLNTHFPVVEPEKRFANLQEWHELYCMGHLIEAAVAHFQATGNRKLLDALCRYADYVDTVIGSEPGKMHGYCGHPEVELALVKLFRATGNKRYLALAKYFVDERGQSPNYFAAEREVLKSKGWGPWGWYSSGFTGCQADKPVREQTDLNGHAVRALYLCTGMADVAAETGDATLRAAIRRLWESVTQRRMYITGGVGSSRHGEKFTFDYDLPNETSYAETCAAIALFFFAHRMLLAQRRSEYSDVMERVLYNGILSGIGMEGTSFLYANPLSVRPEAGWEQTGFEPGRQKWFDCACCPPNVARLLASLGGYVYSANTDSIDVHLYIAGTAHASVAGVNVELTQTHNYPWDGAIALAVTPESPAKFAVRMRVPGWCTKHAVSVNGTKTVAKIVDGYAVLTRTWRKGDRVALILDMPVRRVYANPAVRQDAGCVALERGPLVYCIEEVDNIKDVHRIVLPRSAKLAATSKPRLLGGTVVISGKALKENDASDKKALYRTKAPAYSPTQVTAIPYFLWGNRTLGCMTVWIRDKC